MHNQRSYRTNLEYENTVRCKALSERCKSFDTSRTGLTTVRFYEFPGIRVQLTTHGYVMIHGGTGETDGTILRTLAPLVKTTDSEPFSWQLSKETFGDKELLTRLAIETHRRIRKGDRRGIDIGYYVDVLRPIALREDKQGTPWHPAHEGAEHPHDANKCPAFTKKDIQNPRLATAEE